MVFPTHSQSTGLPYNYAPSASSPEPAVEAASEPSSNFLRALLQKIGWPLKMKRGHMETIWEDEDQNEPSREMGDDRVQQDAGDFNQSPSQSVSSHAVALLMRELTPSLA